MYERMLEYTEGSVSVLGLHIFMPILYCRLIMLVAYAIENDETLLTKTDNKVFPQSPYIDLADFLVRAVIVISCNLLVPSSESLQCVFCNPILQTSSLTIFQIDPYDAILIEDLYTCLSISDPRTGVPFTRMSTCSRLAM